MRTSGAATTFTENTQSSVYIAPRLAFLEDMGRMSCDCRRARRRTHSFFLGFATLSPRHHLIREYIELVVAW